MSTALDRNSKADTVFFGNLADGGFDEIANDISQRRTNLTDNGSYHNETSSARTAITYPREVTVMFSARTGDSGILVSHATSDLSAYTFVMSVSSGLVRCYENTVERVNIAIPALGASLRYYVAQWSTRADGTSVRSELTVTEITTGLTSLGFATHAACTTDASYAFTVSGYGAGVGGFTSDQIQGVRIGTRFHSQAECYEDHVSESAAPTITGTVRPAALPIEGLPTSDEGLFAGPAYLVAGAGAREADRRLAGPVVNVRASNPLDSQGLTNYEGAPQRYRAVPGASAYKFSDGQVWYRPVPPHCNRVSARVFVNMYTDGAGPADLSLRMYSLGNYPFAGEVPAGPQVVHYGATTTINYEHEEGEGAWVELGSLQVSRDADGYGWSLFALAHYIDPEETGASDTRFNLRAVELEPYYQDSGGGFGADVDTDG